MRVLLRRLPGSVCVDTFSGKPGSALLDALDAHLLENSMPTRDLAERLRASPISGTVAELAERARLWLISRGHEVQIQDE
jgi:hypothetical protein